LHMGGTPTEVGQTLYARRHTSKESDQDELYDHILGTIYEMTEHKIELIVYMDIRVKRVKTYILSVGTYEQRVYKQNGNGN
jgi:hypothetical protein